MQWYYEQLNVNRANFKKDGDYMNFQGFSEDDFDVFAVEGLDERMNALKENIRPKLEFLGEHFKDFLTHKTGSDIYYHVAKHARRKVNPPDDTWVAFGNSKRGYKKLPHFQIGLFGSHVFVWFAVIYESPVKEALGHTLHEKAEEILRDIPNSFEWSIDHTKPDTLSHSDLTEESFKKMTNRLTEIKKAEILCGITLDDENPAVKDGKVLIEKIEEAFTTLLPLYELSMELYEQKV